MSKSQNYLSDIRGLTVLDHVAVKIFAINQKNFSLVIVWLVLFKVSQIKDVDVSGNVNRLFPNAVLAASNSGIVQFLIDHHELLVSFLSPRFVGR